MGSIIINAATTTRSATMLSLSLFVSFCIIHPLLFLSLSYEVESYYIPSSPAISRIRTTTTSRIKSRTLLLQHANLKSRVNEDEIEIVSNDDMELSSSSSSDDTTTTTTTTFSATSPTSTRRIALSTMTTSAAAAATAAMFFSSSSSPALASVAEIDKSTGSLYTPKKEMLAGGSNAARGGIPSRTNDGSPGEKLKSGEQIQTVYETRFIAYLSRFLINFDDAANSFWKTSTTSSSSSSSSSDDSITKSTIDFKFAEFSESVEIGLADYFVGPYGSYSSLSAMKAGINANYQAKSKRYDDDKNNKSNNIGESILSKLALSSSRKSKSNSKSKSDMQIKKIARKEASARDRFAKQGVLSLYTLLKARYTSRNAKRQLAILFSFITNPALQPTAEIRSLLAEVDNASITNIEINKLFTRNELTSRTSSRRGGGYSHSELPTIDIESPPALGSAYKVAKAGPVMKETTRVLRINVVDGGEGYTKAPDVYVSLPVAGVGLSSRQCVAQAIIDRKGHIESVVVLDPGYGYGKSKNEVPPIVIIRPPKFQGIKNNKGLRQATAKAKLEYKVDEIDVIEGGNGYVATDPPKIFISPPEEDPDWYVDIAELAVLEEASVDRRPFQAKVAKMRGPKGNLVFSIDRIQPSLTDLPLERVGDDPIALLPSVVRPELNSYGTYVIPSVAAVRTYDDVKNNPRFRAVDPLFGAIGALPAQKSAMELKPNEYGRLALSGAVCTVLVRTALNPLELIKTKLQLENDKELLSYARQSIAGTTTNESPKTPHLETVIKSENENDKNQPYFATEEEGESNVAVASKPQLPTDVNNTDIHLEETAVKISSNELIGSLIELRGPAALFQSADITLLASLVFGSLGFGATELFRRSFSEIFFVGGDGGVGFRSQLVLLLAASLATIITCAVAAPFELLRVRSMGLVESQKWIDVMKDFLKEKLNINDDANGDSDLDLKALDLKDFVPLWAGFGPTASRELAFAIPKFLAFDIIAKAITGLINSQMGQGALPIQVGIGGAGLAISAISGAFAGLAGAIVSHPADLILTKLSASKPAATATTDENGITKDELESSSTADADWKEIIKDLLSKEGGVANLYVGLTPRLVFFFLVIGLQFFLYDYVKNLLEVGSDDLSLVLDVFYAVRQGLQ
jgi:hypothetical protein